MTAALATATVMLGAVALGVALFAIWGSRDMKAASMEAAEKEARRIAEAVASREIAAFLDQKGVGADISEAYRDKPS